MPPPPTPRYGYRKLNIDLSLVPPSRHSVFVRGLPRNASAEDIRDIFDDECGRCTVLFQKSRLNGIFMVLRFERTEDAKEAINRFDGWRYKGQYRLSVNWYKDVLKYHLQQKQKHAGFSNQQSGPPPMYSNSDSFNKYQSYGHRAVNRAKKWYHTRPMYNKTARPLNRSFDRSFNRPRSRPFNRSFDRSRRKSCERSERGSKDSSSDRSRSRSRSRSRERSLDRSLERSMDRSHERSMEESHERSREASPEHSMDRSGDESMSQDCFDDLPKGKSGKTDKRSQERSYERSHERSRERSYERSTDRSYENEPVKTFEKATRSESPYDPADDIQRQPQERLLDKLQEIHTERTSMSPEHTKLKKPTEKRSSRHSPDYERNAKRKRHELHQGRESVEGEMADKGAAWEPPAGASEAAGTSQAEVDLEPGEIDSGPSPDESPRKWDPVSESNQQGKSSKDPNQLGHGICLPLKGNKSLWSRASAKTQPTSKTMSPGKSPGKSTSDSQRASWIEVGKIARKGPKAQFRKIMMGSESNLVFQKEKESEDEGKHVSAHSNAGRDEGSSVERTEETSDLKMKRLEEACLTLHNKSRDKFTREILGPKGPGSESATKLSKPERKPLSSLELIRAEEMAQLEADAGGHSYDLKSPLLKTPKKNPSFINPEDDTPTKDEREGDSEAGPGSKPFFLRFTPHRLSYQSPLAIFSSLEEPTLAGDSGMSTKSTQHDKKQDSVESLVSKLTGTKRHSERKDTAIPSDERIDVDFIDFVLEKSYEEKCSDNHGRSESQNINPLVPYSMEESFNKTGEGASYSRRGSTRDEGPIGEEQGEFVSHTARRSRSSKKKKHRSSSHGSSSKHDTSESMSMSNTTLDTSGSSFCSPTKAHKHRHKSKHHHARKLKTSMSPNSSIWSTVSRSRSPSPMRSMSPENKALREQPRSRSGSPCSSESSSARLRRQLLEGRARSLSPSNRTHGNRSTSPNNRSRSPGNTSWSPTRQRKKTSPINSRSPSPISNETNRRRKERSPSPMYQTISRSPTLSNKSFSPSKSMRWYGERPPGRPRSRSPSPEDRSPQKHHHKSRESGQTSRDRRHSSRESGASSRDLLSPSKPLSLHSRDMLTSTPAKSDHRPRRKALSRGQMQRVLQKKRELEMAFKSDCETICSVTKVLLSKDQSLEEQLCNSAKKTLTDLGAKFVSQLQEFIDSLSVNLPPPQESIPPTKRITLDTI